MASDAKDASKKYEEVDDVLTSIGAYGRYQVFLQIIFALIAVPEAIQFLIMFFAADVPSWICTSNSTTCMIGSPMVIYEHSADDLRRCDLPRGDWRYTRDTDYSIVTEFGLDCESAWMAQLPTSVLYLGVACGSFVIGWLGDRFGRRTVLLPSILFLQIFSLATAFSPTIEYLIVFRFVVGFFIPGISINLGTMLSELVVARHRAWACPSLFILWPFGLGLLSLIAYSIPRWRYMMVAASAPFFVAVVCAYFAPESIRWLLAKGDKQQAVKLLENIARRNKESLPVDIKLAVPPSTKKSSPKDLFSTCKMTTMTLLVCLKWFGVGLVYYGIPMAADDITNGSMYINFTLTCMIELPALFTCSYAMNKFGRRGTCAATLFLTGISCVFIGVAPHGWTIARLVVGILSRFFISLTYASIYTWTLELFPTLLRSQGIGFGSFWGKLGCIVMPWIVKSTKQLHQMTPFISMGALAILISCALLGLPETKGKQFSTNQTTSPDASEPMPDV